MNKYQQKIFDLLELSRGIIDMDTLRNASGLTRLELESELFRMKNEGIINIHSHEVFPMPGRVFQFYQVELIGFKPDVIKDDNYILQLTAEVFNTFITLDEVHPCDKKDITFHIHAIQNIMFARRYLKINAKKEEIKDDN